MSMNRDVLNTVLQIPVQTAARPCRHKFSHCGRTYHPAWICPYISRNWLFTPVKTSFTFIPGITTSARPYLWPILIFVTHLHSRSPRVSPSSPLTKYAQSTLAFLPTTTPPLFCPESQPPPLLFPVQTDHSRYFHTFHRLQMPYQHRKCISNVDTLLTTNCLLLYITSFGQVSIISMIWRCHSVPQSPPPNSILMKRLRHQSEFKCRRLFSYQKYNKTMISHRTWIDDDYVQNQAARLAAMPRKSSSLCITRPRSIFLSRIETRNKWVESIYQTENSSTSSSASPTRFFYSSPNKYLRLSMSTRRPSCRNGICADVALQPKQDFSSLQETCIALLPSKTAANSDQSRLRLSRLRRLFDTICLQDPVWFPISCLVLYLEILVHPTHREISMRSRK